MNYKKTTTLIESVENFKQRNSCYPEAVLTDRIYRNQDNLAYCKEHGIRLSGPKLGRPPAKLLVKKAEKRIERLDAQDHLWNDWKMKSNIKFRNIRIRSILDQGKH